MRLIALSFLSALSEVQPLHVVQIIDSIVLEKEEFLELRNFNDASSASSETGAFAQEIDFGITNNFENFKYDVFFFKVDEEGHSDALECYKQAVYSKLWDTDCNFAADANTEVLTGQLTTSNRIKSADDSNDHDIIIVIDNTPLPKGGSEAEDNIVLEYSVSSKFEMAYNLRNVSIVMGIISMIISFAIGSLSYLAYKIKSDITRKFLSDDDDKDDEEEEEEEI